MQFSVKVTNPSKSRSVNNNTLVFAVFEASKTGKPDQLSAAAEAFDQAHDGYLSQLLQRGDLSGKIGQSSALFHIPGSSCERVLLIGCGKAKELSAHQYRKIVAASSKALLATGAKEAVSYLANLAVRERDLSWCIGQLVQSISTSRYRFEQLKSTPPAPKPTLKKLCFNLTSRKDTKLAKQALVEAQALATGVAFAKDLGNLPGNICTPSYLAEQAQQLAKDYKALQTKILEQTDMEKLGMGSFLAVAQGSEEPAKFIVMEYLNSDKSQKPIVLVGKGVTFDTGGISLKPGAAMDEMKFDMCGAASVFGTLKACAEMSLTMNVIGIVAATENMPDGKAIKPGDIVTSMSKQTIEILNTDAEGRLVLCDALTYSERYKPQVVVDIATLTGACVVALGSHPHGLFSNSPNLAGQLLAAGEQSTDRCWQLPIWDEYQEQLKSNFADMANIGGREAGAITAACFLSRFTKNLTWAHLDIAGTAWLKGGNKGASGRPVPLLTQFILAQSKLTKE